MIPAKLLGLHQTEDSIILRTSDAAWQAKASLDLRIGGENGEARGPRDVLRSLVALRKRGERN